MLVTVTYTITTESQSFEFTIDKSRVSGLDVIVGLRQSETYDLATAKS